VPEAKAWNLDQVHDPDGSPSRFGALMGDVEFRFRQVLGSLSFEGAGIPGFGGELAGREGATIDDPLSVCLENVVELEGLDSERRATVGLQAELFSWLAVDCTYVLSRERCVLGLGRLARRVEARVPLHPPWSERGELEVDGSGEALQPAGPAEVAELVRAVVAATDPLLRRGRTEADAANLVATLESLPLERLDRAGARRLLAALNVLVSGRPVDAQPLAPLGRLHDDVVRRLCGLALGEALDDPHPVVRAAALEACVKGSRNAAPVALRMAMSDSDPLVVSRALELVAELGLPQPEAEFPGGPDEYREAWLRMTVELLQVAFDGPVAIGGCRAMARMTGEPQNLRPEHWVGWWEARLAARELAP